MIRNMFLCICCTIVSLSHGWAQRKIWADTLVVTEHEVTVKGVRFGYTAKAGAQPVWDEQGNAIASVHYIYYQRKGIADRDTRPLLISFNGGPGTASVWMQMAYTGPRLLNIDDEGYPVQPYGFQENPYSLLDVADIVYIDPVNTGYSRMTDPKGDKSTFFGTNADIKYLAEWINTFVSREDRWPSPKYLIGESYGTTRVSGLALELQNAQWMYLNGVILVSPTGLGLDRGGPAAKALRWPYFAATAWFHKAQPNDLQQKDLTEMLPEVEAFALNELMPALARGGSLSPAERQAVAEKMSRYSGLSSKVILQQNLDVETSFFWKELLRDKGFTVGRLDSRYLGIDQKDGGERPDYAAELTSWLHSFTPAIHHYYKKELKFNTDLKYYMFGPVQPWDRSNDKTGMNLRQAMAQNPYLHVLVQSGYYDGACDYFNAKYNLWQMDPGGKLQSRMDWKGYRSGHMMYLRKEDLKTANEDLRDFIARTIPGKGVPAKYAMDNKK
ncbi:S10 family peptidase [Olivibacter sitiensis]|uniref:S10 family peptidase n=1 Tax=Olivibacter sitiensis TaxID=376470 RepID=UPI00042222DB|nr:carboxypeptidase [Olivibacter sitiensis]